MLPMLRKFLTRPSRSRTDTEATISDGLPRGLTDQDNLFVEDPYRSRTGSVDENIFNQELHFIVDYLGYCQVSEVQSISLLLESVKRVKKGCSKPSRVDFVIKEGVLKISTVGCHALILTVPLYIVALCAQESLRGFDKCFGLNITRKNAHLCYVFQAGSSLEVRCKKHRISKLHRHVVTERKELSVLKNSFRLLEVIVNPASVSTFPRGSHNVITKPCVIKRIAGDHSKRSKLHKLAVSSCLITTSRNISYKNKITAISLSPFKAPFMNNFTPFEITRGNLIPLKNALVCFSDAPITSYSQIVIFVLVHFTRRDLCHFLL